MRCIADLLDLVGRSPLQPNKPVLRIRMNLYQFIKFRVKGGAVPVLGCLENWKQQKRHRADGKARASKHVIVPVKERRAADPAVCDGYPQHPRSTSNGSQGS